MTLGKRYSAEGEEGILSIPPGMSGETPRFSVALVIFEKLPCSLDTLHRIHSKPVGADAVSKLLSDGCPSNTGFHSSLQPCFSESNHGVLHGMHRHRVEAREQKKIGFLLPDRPNEMLGRDIDPEIDHLDAGSIHEHEDNILA